ncbi:MAG: TlpA family protein disulfide reductase [Bacteroidia bacterium]|nr:TlpA family protein disulfide reductase [Bacteroidia bacterium]
MKTYTYLTWTCLLFSILGFQSSLFAQDTLTIHFDPDYEIVRKNSHGFTRTYSTSQKEITYREQKIEFTYPKNFQVSDTAFMFEYFTGWKNPAIPKNTAILLGDYKGQKPAVYVDYNHNLDFSDDGEATVANSDSTLVIYFRNSELDGAYFPVRYYYGNENEEKRKDIEGWLGPVGPKAGGYSLLSSEYWFFTQRMNNRLGRLYLNGERILLGLHDYNCNGLYNDEESDRIMLGDYESNSISEDRKNGARILEDSLQIKLGGLVYDVIEVDPRGDFMKLVKSSRPYVEGYVVGSSLKNLAINLSTGIGTELETFIDGEKYILLEFWGMWCKPCVASMPSVVELHKDYGDRLKIIGMNYGDNMDRDRIKKFKKKHKMSWPIAFASEKQIEDLKVDGFPTYMLLDKDGKILEMNTTITSIKKMLDK